MVLGYSSTGEVIEVPGITEEIWKDIAGWETHYQVSNLGNVRSKDRVINFIDGRTREYKSRRLSKTEDKDGYLHVCLKSNGHYKTMKVHRLVASAFCERGKWRDIVHHIDANPKNNCASNLTWSTTKENVAESWKSGRNKNKYGASHHNSKLTIAQCKKIMKLYDEGHRRETIAAIFDVSIGTVNNIGRRVTDFHRSLSDKISDGERNRRKNEYEKTIVKSHGQENPMAKLSEEDVLDVRKQGSAMSAKKLAEKYGVHVGTIYKILQGTRWKNVN
jgi:transposase